MSWLWKGDASSPASFEKALSKLSTQITAANLSLETTRSRGRRLKALWTLYTTLTYLVALLILVLVIGPQDWSLPHYGGLIGFPVIIFGVRFAVASAFNWRTSRQQAHLNQLQKQREEKITALKKATKYDSTQELLQKYGGAPPKQNNTKESPQPKTKPNTQVPHGRTGIPPPPTANIRPQSAISSPMTPQRIQQDSPISVRQGISPTSPLSPDEPGFAPNAFSSQPVTSPHGQSSHWYDRILDVLLGEDEASAKNRLVLLCQNCRLVNGQAPPGVRTLEELGKWRCSSCGAWNGQESEATKMVKQMTEKSKLMASEDWEKVSHGEEDGQDLVDDQHLNGDRGVGTGTETELGSVTKRVTRSTGEPPVEGL